MSESQRARRSPSARGDGSTLGRRTFLRVGAGGAAVAATADPAAAQSYGGWMADVSNYEGTVDYTGREEVNVSVGAGENGLLFDPPAVLVDPGTTVVWEWTGTGGARGVVHDPDGDGEPAFESEVVDDAAHTFSYEFRESATFRYYSPDHRNDGMKGVVAVGSTDDALVQPAGDGDDGAGGSLTTTDLVVAVTAVALGVVLVLMAASAASNPGPDRPRSR